MPAHTQKTTAHLQHGAATACKCLATLHSKAIKTVLRAALHSIKEALRKHWRWLAVSALVAASTMLSCGASVLSTRPVCTTINTAIASLLLPIGIRMNAPTSNSDENITSHTTTLFAPATFRNSYGAYAKTSPKKYAISTAENTETKTNARITISASSINPSKTKRYSRMMKASTPTLHQLWTDFGHTASQLSRLSILKPPLTPQNILLRKLPANKHGIITCVVTNTVKHSGFYLSTYECPLAETNPAG